MSPVTCIVDSVPNNNNNNNNKHCLCEVTAAIRHRVLSIYWQCGSAPGILRSAPLHWAFCMKPYAALWMTTSRWKYMNVPSYWWLTLDTRGTLITYKVISLYTYITHTHTHTHTEHTHTHTHIHTQRERVKGHAHFSSLDIMYTVSKKADCDWQNT